MAIHKHRLRKGHGSHGIAADIARPEDGDPCLGSLNRKDKLGMITLARATQLGYELRMLLDDHDVGFRPMGASALGVSVAVPHNYMKRPTSNLFDLQFRGDERERASAALVGHGFGVVDAARYFTITFVGRDGKEHTVPTLSDQLLFSRQYDDAKLYVTAIFMPSEYYRNDKGVVRVVSFGEMQTVGVSMMQKLLRGAKRDKNDLAHVALANDLSALFSGRSLELLSGAVAGGTAVREMVSATIDDIIDKVRDLQTAGHGNGIANGNMATLHWFKDIARAA